MLSTLEPESAYSAFKLNLVSELAPLQRGNERTERTDPAGRVRGPPSVRPGGVRGKAVQVVDTRLIPAR